MPVRQTVVAHMRTIGDLLMRFQAIWSFTGINHYISSTKEGDRCGDFCTGTSTQCIHISYVVSNERWLSSPCNMDVTLAESDDSEMALYYIIHVIISRWLQLLVHQHQMMLLKHLLEQQENYF